MFAQEYDRVGVDFIPVSADGFSKILGLIRIRRSDANISH